MAGAAGRRLTSRRRGAYSEQRRPRGARLKMSRRRSPAMLNPVQIGEAVGGAWRRFRCSPEELRAHQQARLRELVGHAIEHSPFYRRHYGSIEAAKVQLEGLPPVNKRLIQANFDDVVTD